MTIEVSQSLKERNYWVEKFSGKLNKCSFLYDYEENCYQKYNKDEIDFQLPEGLSSKIISLSNESDYRLHMILTTGVISILYKYTLTRDLIVGTSIYNQDNESDFINTIIPLCVQVNSGMSYKELLLNVRQLIMEGTENQNYPVDKLIKELCSIEYNELGSLFDVFVILDNIQDKKYIEKYNSNILFVFNHNNGKLSGKIDYNNNLYDRHSIERIISNLIRLFEAMITNINSSIDDTEIISQQEKDSLIVNFNNTDFERNSFNTIYELFQEQVKINPNSVAVKCDSYQITYKQLNEKSNQLAYILKKKGTQLEDKIGIMMKPSIEVVIAILATLKSGSAYVPIDISYPKDRIEYIIKNSEINRLIIDDSHEIEFSFNGDIIIYDKASLENEPTSNLCNLAKGNNAAYIIYTSGSTGNPKGVIVEHKSVTNTLLWYISYYKYSSKNIILQSTSLSFDASIIVMFSGLISGATVVIIDYRKLLEYEQIEEIIEENDITDVSIVPSIYKVLLNRKYKAFKRLKSITLVGENIDRAITKEHFEKLKDVKLFNGYGPTENSICTTSYELTKEMSKVLIGKPIDNVKCFVLDNNNKLVPQGAKGELCVSGYGLARGYINDDVLTNKKFIECPFIKGEKMYKTGDYVRWHNSGDLEFLGRIDDQIKINGYRIELGEIENTLLRNEKVKDAVTTMAKNANDENYICAYFVASENIVVADLREYLDKKMPKYMIPSLFVELEEIPRTISGKIDKKALNDLVKKIKENEYISPRDEVEEKLCKIYEQILGIKDIGIKDSYFHLGGDSIKSISLISSINDEMNVKLEIADVYNNETIEEVAKKIKNYHANSEKNELEYNAVLREMDELKKLVMKGE